MTLTSAKVSLYAIAFEEKWHDMSWVEISVTTIYSGGGLGGAVQGRVEESVLETPNNQELMRQLSREEMYDELVRRGAHRLAKVTFRNNRSTIWSLTQDATVLNLHEAYRGAPDSVLDAFASIVRGRGWRTASVRGASEVVRRWPGLKPAMECALEGQQRAVAGDGGCDAAREKTHCCATGAQRRYLRALYAYLNTTRFEGRLPADLPIRLSSRMRSSLGHVIVGGNGDEGRYVVEIALSVDLMLEGNGAERVDTLLHEMAHAADWLFDGHHGHGASWKEWARRAGCRADVRYDRPFTRRGHNGRVTRVPPLPAALETQAA
jgi:hypothetical protein